MLARSSMLRALVDIFTSAGEKPEAKEVTNKNHLGRSDWIKLLAQILTTRILETTLLQPDCPVHWYASPVLIGKLTLIGCLGKFWGGSSGYLLICQSVLLTLYQHMCCKGKADKTSTNSTLILGMTTIMMFVRVLCLLQLYCLYVCLFDACVPWVALSCTKLLCCWVLVLKAT